MDRNADEEIVGSYEEELVCVGSDEGELVCVVDELIDGDHVDITEGVVGTVDGVSVEPSASDMLGDGLGRLRADVRLVLEVPTSNHDVGFRHVYPAATPLGPVTFRRTSEFPSESKYRMTFVSMSDTIRRLIALSITMYANTDTELS